MIVSALICHKHTVERDRLVAAAERALQELGLRDHTVLSRATGCIPEIDSIRHDRPLVVFHINNDERPTFLPHCRKVCGLPVLLVTSGPEPRGRLTVDGVEYPILGAAHDRADELRQLIVLMHRENADLESCWSRLPALRRARLQTVLDALAAVDLLAQSCLRSGGRVDREVFDAAFAAVSTESAPFTPACDQFLDSLVSGGDASRLPAHSRSGSALQEWWSRLRPGWVEGADCADFNAVAARSHNDYRKSSAVLASAWPGEPVIMVKEPGSPAQNLLQQLEARRVAVNHDHLRNAFLEWMGSALAEDVLTAMRVDMAEKAWDHLRQPRDALRASRVSVAKAMENWPRVREHVRSFLVDAPRELGLDPQPPWTAARNAFLDPESGCLEIMDGFVRDFSRLAHATPGVRRDRLLRFWQAADRAHGVIRSMHGRLGEYVAIRTPEPR